MDERAAGTWFALLSAGGIGLLGAAAARAVIAGPPEPARLAGACAHAVIPKPTVGWAATALLSALVAVSLARAGRAVTSMVQARARLRRVGARRRLVSGREVVLVPSARALAFCGGLRRPRIHLSSRTLELLDHRQLDAVIAHEEHHVRRRDPLRLAARLLLGRALFFLPGLATLSARLEELSEQAADEHAIRAARGDARPLVGALLAFDAVAAPATAGISPARVDRLVGPGARWPLPGRQIVLSAAVLAALAALLAASASASPAEAAALQVCLVSIAVLGTAGSPLAAALASRAGRA